LLVETMQTLLDEATPRCAPASTPRSFFEKLGAALGRSPRNLMRMFDPSGSPTAENLLGASAYCRGGR
jgi:hypothetical protein